MRLIVLAAGKGTRLLPLTKETPKILIDAGGGTILDKQMENAIDSKYITEVLIITGHLSHKIEDHLKRYRDKIKIDVLFNPFYDISNSRGHHIILDCL